MLNNKLLPVVVGLWHALGCLPAQPWPRLPCAQQSRLQHSQLTPAAAALEAAQVPGDGLRTRPL